MAACSVLGGEPKVFMLVSGLAAIVLFFDDRPLAGGVAVACSALFWQPGGLFLLGAASLPVLICTGRSKWSRIGLLLVGFSIPWIITIMVYLALGSFERFFFQVLTFNFGYLNSNFPGNGLGSHILRIATSIDRIDQILFVAGFMGWGNWVVFRRAGPDSRNASLGAIFIAAAFAGLSALNHQGPADFLPLQVMCAFGFPAALALAGKRFTPGIRKAVIVVIFMASVIRGFTMPVWAGPPRLDDQRSVLAPVAHDLRASGRGVWCAGVPELLVFFDLPNATRYTYLHSNVHEVLEEYEAMPLWRFVLERESVQGDLVLIDRIPEQLDRRICTELARAAPNIVIRGGLTSA